MKKALLLVDIQYDFLPGGALPVPEGNEVVAVANKLMPLFEHVLASKDWHPANHGSFAANHPWRFPGQVIKLNGLDQILWPIHCVQDSFGSEFAPGLHEEWIKRVFLKGIDPEIDSYSAFFDNDHRRSTGLEDYLRDLGIKTLYAMGLATDYCVKYTVLDALRLGFTTYLVVDGVRGIDKEPGDAERALREMAEQGAVLIDSSQLVQRLSS